MSWLFWPVLGLYVLASIGLIIYGLNTYVLLFLYRRSIKETRQAQKERKEKFLAKAEGLGDEAWPVVTTQIPLYNERNVAERVIRAVAAFDYPAGRHQIQVVDDSNDETVDLVDGVVEDLAKSGVWIEACRRDDRAGYKAGGLKVAMEKAKGEFIAIFDSDFVPEPDFLREIMPLFKDEKTALVQSRWGHLNAEHSLLTRAQSVGVDGHFVVEQIARTANGLFLNFNGTAGVWRKEAIIDGGGWQADTLTEDLDLSYRCQLKGWHLEYAIDVVVPAELPETYSAFKSQQFRWAKGSVQTAKKLLPRVLGSDVGWLPKLQSVFHLSTLCGAHADVDARGPFLATESDGSADAHHGGHLASYLAFDFGDSWTQCALHGQSALSLPEELDEEVSLFARNGGAGFRNLYFKYESSIGSPARGEERLRPHSQARRHRGQTLPY